MYEKQKAPQKLGFNDFMKCWYNRHPNHWLDQPFCFFVTIISTCTRWYHGITRYGSISSIIKKKKTGIWPVVLNAFHWIKVLRKVDSTSYVSTTQNYSHFPEEAIFTYAFIHPSNGIFFFTINFFFPFIFLRNS